MEEEKIKRMKDKFRKAINNSKDTESLTPEQKEKFADKITEWFLINKREITAKEYHKLKCEAEK